MKRDQLFFSALIFISILLFHSCKTAQTSMEVLRPAEINIPTHVKKVAVINRSLPGREDRLLNIIEGLVTGEPIFADREGSNHCVNGLIDQLNNGPRFNAILATSSDLYGTGTRQFAPAISWFRVDSLCRTYGVDALIVLEAFDSNIGIKEGSREVKRRRDGREYIEKIFSAEMCIDVNSGWRIYDNINKRIIDHNYYMEERCWKRDGSNMNEARRKLPSRRRAINQAGRFAGEQYGFRISPNWIRVNRTYFVRGHDGFQEARRHVRHNNWDAAEQIWQNLSKSTDPKVAGRAMFNLALAFEIKGDLDQAIIYAKRALREFRIREARRYIVTLERRQADEYRLDQQMNSK